MRVHIHLGQMLMGIKTAAFSSVSSPWSQHLIQSCWLWWEHLAWGSFSKHAAQLSECVRQRQACWVNGVKMDSLFSQRMGFVSPRTGFSSAGAVVRVLLAGWWSCVALFSVSVVPPGAQLQPASCSCHMLSQGSCKGIRQEHFVVIYKASLLCTVNLIFQLHAEHGYFCFTLPLVQLLSEAHWEFPQTCCDIAAMVTVTA